MAEVEGSDGNQYNIPDFALEDTQEKILATLKKAFNLNDKDIANAQKALDNDNKNSKAQIDALRQLGADIQTSAKGGGSLLGGLSKGLGIAGGALSFLTKGFVGLSATVATVGAGMAALAVNLTKGFGDDLKNAGLAETGAAFGDLGAELNTVVPGLMTLGYSVEDAAGAINDFRGAMTATSGKAIQGVITEFNKLTNGGARYGRTLTENLDYLADEIEFRTRLGFIDSQNTKQAATDAQEMMDNQINASKLLGKSVDEIANGVKDLFSGDLDIAAQLASLGPEAEQGLRKAFNTLEGAGLPKDLQAGMLKYMTDPIALASEEARSVFNDINLLPKHMGKPVIDAMENVRTAIESGNPKAIEAAQKAYAKATLALGPQIKALGVEEKKQLILLGKSRQGLQGFIASQNTLAIAAENYGKINHEQVDALNESIKNSVMFDNQITAIGNTFDIIKKTLQAGFAPALANITGILGNIADPESPLGSFQVKLASISEAFVKSLNKLLGTTDSSSKATDVAKSMLERFAGYIESAGNGVLSLVPAFQETGGDSFLERIATFFMDSVLKPLGSMIGDLLARAWEKIDLTDILTGNTDNAVAERSRDFVDQEKNYLDGMKNAKTIDDAEYNKRLKQAKTDAAKEVLDRSGNKGYDSQETTKLLEKAGLALQDLSGAQLAEIFPDPKALEDAIVKSGGSQEDYTSLSNTIAESLKSQSGKRNLPWQKGLSKSLDDQSEAFKKAADTIIKTPPKIELPAEQSAVDTIEKTIDSATKANETPGTRPVTQSSTSVITDPETAKPTTPGPTSQDGTSTQAVKPAVPMADASNQENAMKSTEDLISILLTKTDTTNKILKSIAGSSSSTASNTG